MLLPEEELICLFLVSDRQHSSNTSVARSKEYTTITLELNDLNVLNSFKVSSLPHSIFVVNKLLVLASCENMISIPLNYFED